MRKIIRVIVVDILRNRVLAVYTLLLLVLSWGSFIVEDNPTKGLLTVLNVILFTVPLVSILFSTIYLYNRTEFIELLLSQPLKRSRVWISFFLGLSVAMILAFFIGAGIPLLLYASGSTSYIMIGVGAIITEIFISIAFLCSVLTRDKTQGIGVAILIWLFFSLIFDALVLFAIFQLNDYPIEKAIIVISTLNPIDLGRINILLHLDASAMLGYVGALFRNSFGTVKGMVISFSLLTLWCVIPLYISLLLFKRKDL